MLENTKRPNWIMGAISNEEIECIENIIEFNKPSNCLEIGVASGWSSGQILKSLQKFTPESTLVGIDFLDYCYWDRTIPVGKYVHSLDYYYKEKYSLFTEHHILSVKEHLENHFEPFDFLFIDANHKHPFPCVDLLFCLSILKETKAIVVLHDINLPFINPQFPSHGVNHLFYELKDCMKFESVSNEFKKSNLGVLFFDFDIYSKQEVAAQLENIIKKFPIEAELSQEYIDRINRRDYGIK